MEIPVVFALDKIFFTSDLHFYHNNVIIHCKRPCTPEEHMDWILNIVNKPLSDDTLMYHLGDLTCNSRVKLQDIKNILDKLEGTWYFVIGNHDNEDQLREACRGTRHKVLGDYVKVTFNKIKFRLLHFPMESWDCKQHGSIHLHGHLHNNVLTTIPNRYNVCLDLEQKVYPLMDFL